MMECESGGQGAQRHRIRPGWISCIVSIVLLLSSLVSVESPNLTWAAVYECIDVSGTPLLTNRPSDLHKCHMLSGGTGTSASPIPINPDSPSLPSYAPAMPQSRPTDHMQSAGSLSASNLGEPLLPSLPCPHRLKSLPPLSTPPCVRPSHSGAQSQPEAAPTPSP
jgi:hypothetical protein